MEEKKIKLQYMNIAKGIGISLIVLGHSYTDASDSSIRSFVYLFHVPLFFILSGYFFKDEYIKDPIKLILRRVRSLWFPYVKWYVFYVLVHNFFLKIYIYNKEIGFHGYGVDRYCIKEIIIKLLRVIIFRGSEQLLGAFWFIPCLFFTVVIFLAIRVISLKSNNKYITPVLCSFLFIIGNLMHLYNMQIPLFPFDLGLFFISSFLYYIGTLYRKYETKIPDSISLAMLSILFLCTLTSLNLIRIESIYSVIGDIKIAVLYLIITPLLGTYLVVFISKKLSQKGWLLFFGKLGEHTIAILALHFLCFKLINYIIVIIYGLDKRFIASLPVIEGYESWFLAYALAGIFLPYTIQLLYKKISILLEKKSRSWRNLSDCPSLVDTFYN